MHIKREISQKVYVLTSLNPQTLVKYVELGPSTMVNMTELDLPTMNVKKGVYEFKFALRGIRK